MKDSESYFARVEELMSTLRARHTAGGDPDPARWDELETIGLARGDRTAEDLMLFGTVRAGRRKRTDRLLHELWTAGTSRAGYVKRDWKELYGLVIGATMRVDDEN